LLGLAALSGLTALGAEAAGRVDAGLRGAVYAGGLGGILLSVAGFAVVLKLARIPAQDPAFWKWWGGGMLLRLALLGVLAAALMVMFTGTDELAPNGRGEHIRGTTGALLALAVVYLAGMFSESIWLYRRLLKNGTAGHG
jgi:hypothetical protein